MTASAHSAHLWNGADFTPIGGSGPAALTLPIVAADSWRSSEGAVSGFEAHCRRFERAVSHMTGRGVPLDIRRGSFWERVAGEILRAHTEQEVSELFPRVSLRRGFLHGTRLGRNESAAHTAHVLILEIRPAPAVRSFTTLAHLPMPDPRRHPRVKGPDLDRLAQARARAVDLGYDDLVLCDDDGTVLETCTGSLMWWEGATALFPKRQNNILPGVTAEQVHLRLASQGIGVRYRDVTIEALRGYPLWFANSLHGISPVTTLLSAGELVPLGRHTQEAEWQKWWLDSGVRPDGAFRG